MHLKIALLRAILRAGLSVALGAAGPAGAVPPPPAQVAANCSAPAYASDVLVCRDPALLALDLRLREALAAFDIATSVVPGAWVEMQEDWFRRRSLCAFSERHGACLRDAYVDRIAVLDALRRAATRPPRRGTTAVCRGAPWGAASVRVRAPVTGALTVEDAEARVFAAATPRQTASDWTPYVSFVAEGAAVRLQRIGAPAIDCHLNETR